jgi:hypothetical protein
MLRDWIARRDLGGGLEFTGDDLGPVESSTYQDVFSGDLITTSHRLGEDDMFTRLLAGPVFHGLERVLRYFKVSVVVFL